MREEGMKDLTLRKRIEAEMPPRDEILGHVECGWLVSRVIKDYFKVEEPTPELSSLGHMRGVPIHHKESLGYKAVFYSVTGKVIKEFDFTPSDRASGLQRFTVQTTRGRHIPPCVACYPDFKKGWYMAIIEDRLITPLEDIQIKFTYPLSHDAVLSFHHAGGFTLSAFWGAVYEGYARIFKEERESDWLSTYGKYGIWGHSMDELFLEGFEEVSPGVFNLAIGS